MIRLHQAVGALAIAIFTVAFASPAVAQATRTWVSGVGDDVNPCSRTAPCKTFAGAISKTATGGEINCLDPGGFGGVTITKSISIICTGVTAGVLVSAGDAINVVLPNAASRVLLEGLDIEGLGTGGNGIDITGFGGVTIRNCSIRRFMGNGVNLKGQAQARVFIIDSLITSNGGGVAVQGLASGANFATLIDTLVDSSAAFAVQVGNSPNKVTLRGSTLTGTGVSISNLGTGSVVSAGATNYLSGSGGPTSTIPLQ